MKIVGFLTVFIVYLSFEPAICGLLDGLLQPQQNSGALGGILDPLLGAQNKGQPQQNIQQNYFQGQNIVGQAGTNLGQAASNGMQNMQTGILQMPISGQYSNMNQQPTSNNGQFNYNRPLNNYEQNNNNARPTNNGHHINNAQENNINNNKGQTNNQYGSNNWDSQPANNQNRPIDNKFGHNTGQNRPVSGGTNCAKVKNVTKQQCAMQVSPVRPSNEPQENKPTLICKDIVVSECA